MTRIITSDGVSLDLDPSAQFEIEFGNPLLEDDRIPVAFSTEIAFPPTQANCGVFGWLGGMMSLPRVTSLPAALELDGVQLLSGTLEFESVEDGVLNYTFSGRDYSSEMDSPIYERTIQTFKAGDESALMDGAYIGIRAPLLVNKSYAGYFSEDCDRLLSGMSGLNLTGARTKYHNHVFQGAFNRLTPAIAAFRIIGTDISVDSSLRTVYNSLYIIAHYRLSESMLSGKFPDDPVEVASFLPDMKLSEFVMNVQKMLCAAVFQDGAGLRMIPASDVLSGSAADTVDWEDKVSDSFTLEMEVAQGYRVEYANSGDDQDSDTDAESIKESAGFGNALGEYATEYGDAAQIVPVRIHGNLYSIHTVHVSGTDADGNAFGAYLTANDILTQDIGGNKVLEGTDTKEMKCGFTLPPCVPCAVHSYGRDGASWKVTGLEARASLAAIIEPVSPDAERGDTVCMRGCL